MPEAEPSPDSKPAPRLGSYLLVQALGSGGMSNVFRAVHEETGSVVAVKVLPRTLAKNVTLLQRFIREAKSAEALDHPNIVSIYDRGFDQGRHYLVLEYVEGRDLHDRVRLNGPLAPDESIRFIREVAEGLRYAASQGMVHRDVKPANLLMTPDGHAKIIDLGLALQTEDEDERVTRDGTTVGTVDYMAPEQARDSRQTSERSDIYSLGCTFYYLLTGSPPFPGGGLADKLARHYKAPIPDPREHRTDVSESLSLLIRKMMEKKPELRFADYTHLITALDAVKNAPVGSGEGVPLDALIVDDDDDDEIGLAPTEPTISGRKGNPADRPPSTRDQVMMAEIVDDDDDDEPSPPPKSSPKVKPATKPSSPPRAPSQPAEISLAELAALDSDDEAATRRQARRSSPSSSSAMRTPPAAPKPPVPAFDAMLDEEDDEEVVGSGGSVRRSGDELPLKTWIAAGVLVGLAIAIVGFGASMIISMSKPTEPEVVSERPEPLPFEPTTNSSNPTPRVKGPTAPTKIVKPSTKTEPVAPVVVVAPEPPAEETAYPADWEAKLFPPPLIKSAAPPDKSKAVVRRILEPGDEPNTNSLGSVLGKASDVVEIADTGPFFEDDCQVAGKSRIIRGRAGLRPIIKVEFTSNETLKEQPAKFVLGGQKIDRLTLEGLDLAVDVRDLPDTQQSLFFCQGAELTIRDCTITIVNGNDPKRPYRFSVFRVEEGSKPNRIVLERSTIRGSIRSLFEVGAARAELVFDRSLVVGDSGPLVLLEQNDKANRSILFHRSLAVIRGAVVEFSGKSIPPVVRSLGSTFAKIEGGNTAGVFTSKAAFPGEPKSVLDWSGEDNAFVGWPAWLTSGTDMAIRVNGLDGIRSAWPGSDLKSRETLESWPVTVLREDVIPADFVPLVPDRKGTLIKIATPHPHLKELTIGSLNRLPTPELSATLIPPFTAPGGGPGVMPGMPGMPRVVAPPPPPPQPNQTGPRPKVAPAQTKGAAPPVQVQVQIDKTFDVTEAPWTGDLGKYLADTILEGTLRATIRVRGAGVYAISPIRLPDGLSITILGDSVEGAKIPMVTFVPKPGAVGRTMIELHGGDLALANLAFATEGKNQPKHWVQVEDSLLAIKHCRFRDPGGILPTSGALISFVARSTKPITSKTGPFNAPTDRPTAKLKNCLIWTGGEAISAEVGRGVVSLDNCLIISGGPAVSLLPQKVDADKFEADLVMERCSISFDKSAIHFGPWLGGPQGPSRPWLISTRLCMFPRTQTTTAGALLQVDPEAMVRGSLFWQSSYDAYDVSRFLVSTGPQPTTAIPPADVKRHWKDLWGVNHSRTVQGPDPRRSESIVRYKDKEKPKAGKVVPGALELDTKVQKDLGVEFKDLPPPPKA